MFPLFTLSIFVDYSIAEKEVFVTKEKNGQAPILIKEYEIIVRVNIIKLQVLSGVWNFPAQHL